MMKVIPKQKSNSSFQRGLYALFLVVFLSSKIHAATPLVDVGISAGMHYFIDENSIRKDGALIRYRLLGQGTLPNMRLYFTGEIGVNCGLRSRIEYVVTVTNADGNKTTTSAASAEMRSVYQGTRQAGELVVACQLANSEYINPNREAEKTPKVLTPAPAQITQPAPQIVAKPKSSGTGFVVSSNGTIVTNHHVISECDQIKVLVNRTLHDAVVIADDESSDLAAIRITTARLSALSLAPGQIELGASITVLGFPLTSVLGTDLKATTGIVSSLSGVRGERRNMQISAAVQPGNSGGPVLDDQGAIVGIVVAKLARRFTAENVNFAIRAPVLRSFLEINSIDIAVAKPIRTISVAEIIKKTAPSTLLLLCY